MAETERTLHDELVTGPPITFAHVGYVGALLLGFFAALDHVLERTPHEIARMCDECMRALTIGEESGDEADTEPGE
jgi:hypothetical protein